MALAVLLAWICYCHYLVVIGGLACDEGWFGETCLYLCHCESGVCDVTTGNCVDGSVCQPPWFGPACQFRDTVYRRAFLPDFLTDHNDSSCNDKVYHTITVKIFVLAGWYRVVARDKESLMNIKARFFHGFHCRDQVEILFNSVTLDVYCSNRHETKMLQLYGSGVPNLCSLYISTGRNIALKQSTWQTGNLFNDQQNFGSQYAVDGSTSHRRCSHTDPSLGGQAKWVITFTNGAYLVNRIILYFKPGDDQGHVLNSAHLLAIGNNFKVVWFYQIAASVAGGSYELTHVKPTVVKEIQIVATERVGSQNLTVSLCEVEVYGESICQPGRYGVNCELSCFCSDQKCQSNGACLSCPNGFRGFTCKETCQAGSYGPRCSYPCHQHCVGNRCHEVDGSCWKCIGGFYGRFCDKQCRPGYFGAECTHRCARSCGKGRCDPVDGRCSACATGYLGKLCQLRCDNGSYGSDCSQSCPAHCQGDGCHYEDGSCTSCRSGYTGMHCDQKCAKGTFGADCKKRCPRTCYQCDHDRGTCDSCLPGYSGTYCDSDIFQEILQRSELYYLLVLLPVLVSICLLFREYKTPGHQQEDLTDEDIH